MKTTEAWAAGVFPLYEGMDAEQVARNREKWRASVHLLGDKWTFLIIQEKISPDSKVRPLTRVAK